MVQRLCFDDAQGGLLAHMFGIAEATAALIIILVLKYKEWRVRNGHEDAAEGLIFPIYLRILWVLVFTSIFEATSASLCSEVLGDDPSITATAACSGGYGLSFALNHLVLDGVSMLFLQKSLGVQSMRRALIWSMMWSFAVGLFLGVTYSDSHQRRVASVVKDSLLTAAYIILLALPQKYLFRRPAFYPYATGFLVLRVVLLIASSLDLSVSHLSCTVNWVTSIALILVKPVLVYQGLRWDSQYWMGVALVPYSEPRLSKTPRLTYFTQLVIGRGKSTGDIATQLLGLEPRTGWDTTMSTVSPASARAIAMSETGVKIINHAHLNLSEWSALGAGGTSRVFKGQYHGKTVALKIAYIQTMTPETVRCLVREARLLQGLTHPNIPLCYGLCVLPPAVCLCVELCERGSLFDTLRSTWYSQQSLHTRLRMALDCARAVAYIHSLSPPIIHSDIKSLNYLVKEDATVKLGDLDMSIHEGLDGEWRPTLHCLDWTAPEVMLEHSSPSTASDCYSLGMVLWELMSRDAPFSSPDLQFRDALVQAVCAEGRRPVVDASTGFDAQLPVSYGLLVQQTFLTDPKARPTADEIVCRLEAMIEDL